MGVTGWALPKWSVSLSSLRTEAQGALVKEEIGKEPPGSGDLTSLTTEPNGIGTHKSRQPNTERTPLPSSFLGTS